MLLITYDFYSWFIKMVNIVSYSIRVQNSGAISVLGSQHAGDRTHNPAYAVIYAVITVRQARSYFPSHRTSSPFERYQIILLGVQGRYASTPPADREWNPRPPGCKCDVTTPPLAHENAMCTCMTLCG